MPSVQHFKANFSQDEARGVAGDTQHELNDSITLYDTDSPVRNLCLVWTDGRRSFFNYAYLLSADLIVSDPLQELLLSFSGQIIILKGYHLGILFDLLLDHRLKTIIAINPRYIVDANRMTGLVTDIYVKRE